MTDHKLLVTVCLDERQIKIAWNWYVNQLNRAKQTFIFTLLVHHFYSIKMIFWPNQGSELADFSVFVKKGFTKINNLMCRDFFILNNLQYEFCKQNKSCRIKVCNLLYHMQFIRSFGKSGSSYTVKHLRRLYKFCPAMF